MSIPWATKSELDTGIKSAKEDLHDEVGETLEVDFGVIIGNGATDPATTTTKTFSVSDGQDTATTLKEVYNIYTMSDTMKSQIQEAYEKLQDGDRTKRVNITKIVFHYLNMLMGSNGMHHHVTYNNVTMDYMPTYAKNKGDTYGNIYYFTESSQFGYVSTSNTITETRFGVSLTFSNNNTNKEVNLTSATMYSRVNGVS